MYLPLAYHLLPPTGLCVLSNLPQDTQYLLCRVGQAMDTDQGGLWSCKLRLNLLDIYELHLSTRVGRRRGLSYSPLAHECESSGFDNFI